MHRSKRHHYSITSSARASSGSGTASPSALAVLRLMISSTFVACCTGRSAGFSPGVGAGDAEKIPDISAVAYQSARRGEVTIRTDRWYRVPERQRSELPALLYEKWIGANHERANPQLKQACESRVNVAFGPRM